MSLLDLIRSIKFRLFAMFSCRHDWQPAKSSGRCVVERCCKCGSERYTILEDEGDHEYTSLAAG